MLMDQSSGDDTVLGVRPPGHPTGVAVSHQSSKDKLAERSPVEFPLREEGRAISSRLEDGVTMASPPPQEDQAAHYGQGVVTSGQAGPCGPAGGGRSSGG